MNRLAGRVAVVTGAGRGLGREHALFLAQHGAKVIVNDSGGSVSGQALQEAPAQLVVDEIRARGGVAVANDHDVADWEGGRELVASTISEFGQLDIVVNNAGILRDRLLVNMQEDEWDDVLRVHLKGHFVVTRWAAEHWRTQHRAGQEPNASIINTSSVSGSHGGFPGQANYAAAKAAILALTASSALELKRYGVRTNALIPAARTRITDTTAEIAERIQPPVDPSDFDAWHPGNVSPLVGMLALAENPFNGHVFYIAGGVVGHLAADRLRRGMFGIQGGHSMTWRRRSATLARSWRPQNSFEGWASRAALSVMGNLCGTRQEVVDS